MKRPFERRLERIHQIRNSQTRAYDFEDFLADLFRSSGFDVFKNPPTARPRQTDLMAIRDEKCFLIEAKWVKAKIGVPEIDEIRSRLRRTTQGVVGCIFSMSDYRTDACNAVTIDRAQEIILFSPDEIWGIVRGDSLRELVQRKREELTLNGKVWFLPKPRHDTRRRDDLFPDSYLAIRHEERTMHHFSCEASQIDDVLFAYEIPSVCWGPLSQNGVGVHISLQTKELSEFFRFVELVHSELGLSSQGSWSIRQMERSWHGFGFNDFCREALRWRKRYRDAKLSFTHHSEDLHYFDSCRGGLVLFSARQRVLHSPSSLHDCRIEIHQVGVPLDMAPFQRICQKADDPFAAFVPFGQPQLRTIRLSRKIWVEPVSLILNHYGPKPLVCGLVVKNPFVGKSIPREIRDDELLSELCSREMITFNLLDWHDLEDTANGYFMDRIEAMQIQDISIFRCVGTWDKLKCRPRPPIVSRVRFAC
jgi:hypothetical protein